MAAATATVESLDFGTFGVSFFIYDYSALKKEEDKLEDAVKYYHPREQIKLAKVKERCSQIVGITSAIWHLTGSWPLVLNLKQEKFALVYEDHYGLVLAGKLTEADGALTRRLRRLYDLFVFYHGSLENVLKQMKGNERAFRDKLEFVWQCYRDEKDRSSGKLGMKGVRSLFDILQFVELPKQGKQYFLKASQILQSSQRREGIWGGCILYDKDILCSQLTPQLTAKILVFAKRSASKRPTNSIGAGLANLPSFIAIYPVYLRPEEYQYLSELRCHPRQTLSTSIPVIPDMPSTSPSPVPVCSSACVVDGRQRSNSGASASSSTPTSRNTSPAARHFFLGGRSSPSRPPGPSPSPQSRRRLFESKPKDDDETNKLEEGQPEASVREDHLAVSRMAPAETDESAVEKPDDVVPNGEVEKSALLRVPEQTPYRLSPLLPGVRSRESDDGKQASSLPSSYSGSLDPQSLTQRDSFLSLTSDDPSRSQSAGSEDSVYVDCKPMLDSSASPSPQLDVDLKPVKGEKAKGTESAGVEKLIEEETAVGSVLVEDDDDGGNPRAMAKRSRSGAISLVGDSDGEDTSEPVPVKRKERQKVDLPDNKVDGLVSAALYIQASEQSNMVLALLAEETLIQDEDTLSRLWEGSLPQLADLQVDVKNCLGTVEHPPTINHFFYVSYNGFENTLETNAFQSSSGASSRSLHSFFKGTKMMRKIFDGDPSVSDMTLRTITGSLTYGRRSIHREVFFQSRRRQSIKAANVHSSANAKDLKHTSGQTLGLETKARTLLSNELGYAIF